MKKAKFVIEIEYDNAEQGMSERGIKVLNYDVQGDYKGLTLALVSGLAFTTGKKNSNFDSFKDKLRLLRATASALASCYGTVRRHGLLGDEGDAAKAETENILGAALKRMVDYISMGLANALDITPEQVKDANAEYKEIHDENLKKDNDGKGQNKQGTDRVDFDDYL